MGYQSVLSKRANELRRNPTFAEKAMMGILSSLGIRYRFQSPRWHDGCRRIFDFWIPLPHRLDIEIDGGYHNKIKDGIKDGYLKAARPTYRIIRFTNDEVLNNADDVKRRLQLVLNQPDHTGKPS